MAVVNRTLDATEQRKVIEQSYPAVVATGVTNMIGLVPWPCVLEGAQMAAAGVSGSPTVQIVVQRFIVGTGFTAIALSAAHAVPAWGTSGVINPTVGVSLLASGNTLLNLQANDVLSILTGGANSACAQLAVECIVRPIQDIKKHMGVI